MTLFASKRQISTAHYITSKNDHCQRTHNNKKTISIIQLGVIHEFTMISIKFMMINTTISIYSDILLNINHYYI